LNLNTIEGRERLQKWTKMNNSFKEMGKALWKFVEAVISAGKWLYRAFCPIIKEISLFKLPDSFRGYVNRYFNCPRAKGLIRSYEAFKSYNYRWMNF